MDVELTCRGCGDAHSISVPESDIIEKECVALVDRSYMGTGMRCSCGHFIEADRDTLQAIHYIEVIDSLVFWIGELEEQIDALKAKVR